MSIDFIIFLQEWSLAIQPSYAALDALMKHFAIPHYYCDYFLIGAHKQVVVICVNLRMLGLDILQEFIKTFRFRFKAHY